MAHGRNITPLLVPVQQRRDLILLRGRTKLREGQGKTRFAQSIGCLLVTDTETEAYE